MGTDIIVLNQTLHPKTPATKLTVLLKLLLTARVVIFDFIKRTNGGSGSGKLNSLSELRLGTNTNNVYSKIAFPTETNRIYAHNYAINHYPNLKFYKFNQGN